MIKKISDWIEIHKCIVPTDYINIWLFEEFGFAIVIGYHLNSIYIQFGFVGINIFFRK